MATASFPTVDSGATAIGWYDSLRSWSFPTVDSGAAVVAMAGQTLGDVTITFETYYRKAQPGRWRDYEG